MKSNNEVQQKLKALACPGMGKVLVDVLMLYREEILGEAALPDIMYAEVVTEIVKSLKKSYRNDMKGEEVAASQGNLEMLISRLLTGEEKPWRNKQQSNGTETE